MIEITITNQQMTTLHPIIKNYKMLLVFTITHIMKKRSDLFSRNLPVCYCVFATDSLFTCLKDKVELFIESIEINTQCVILINVIYTSIKELIKTRIILRERILFISNYANMHQNISITCIFTIYKIFTNIQITNNGSSKTSCLFVSSRFYTFSNI